MTDLTVEHYFTTPVYTLDAPQFLDSVRLVSEEHLARIRSKNNLDEIYPVYMSEDYSQDSRIEEFAQLVADSAASILDMQGYDSSRFVTRFSSMWTQEHYKHSAMDQHNHPGSQVVGFYFLDVPDDSSRVVFHDPRIAKTMIDIAERDVSQATTASQMINFTPRPGLLIFTNSWLSHSFTRHRSEQPIRFTHFNLYADFSSALGRDVEVI